MSKIEILTRSESVRYLGQLITFQHQETTEIKNRVRTAWATFHKYRQEVTSKNYFLKHRLRLFDEAITSMPQFLRRYTAHREHGHPPKSVKECYNRRNAKCSVSSIKQKEDTKRSRNTKLRTAKTSCTNDESEDRESDTSHNDQDSDVSFEIDIDEEIDAAEIDEEEWIEYIRRSTIEVIEKMENEKIRCWKLTQRKMKWRLAMRIATSQKERWLIKAAEGNPELSSKYRTNRSIGRPRKRWEDDINEFLKQN